MTDVPIWERPYTMDRPCVVTRQCLPQLQRVFILYVFADKGAKPASGGRKTFHDLDVGEAGDGVSVGVNRPVLKFDRNKIIAGVVRRYTRVAA